MRSSMSINVIGGLIGLMTLFGFIICLVGNLCFTNAFKSEYSNVTHHMADTAAMQVNGDNLSKYLVGEEEEEYLATKKNLDTTCYKLNVSLIYVIQVDRSDYSRFTSIFNAVDNGVDNTNYSPWPLGYQRNTTNEEYRSKYQALYEKKTDFETVFRTHTTDGQHPHITTLVPIRNSYNEVTGILCMQRPIKEMSDSIAPYLFSIIGAVIAMVVVLSLLATIYLRKSINKPISKVSKEATRFAKESTVADPLGKISRYEVMQELANSIDSMEADTVKYMDTLTAVTAEKEKIGAELAIASNIQQDSLPKVEGAFKDRDDFEIYASMDPAKEVGGDFYNFFLIDDDHLAVTIADVSGKGVPAALFMMVTNIVIGNRTRLGGTPAEILEFVNKNICDHNHTGMFVTVWLGILELSTGKLLSANAGHEDPIIYRNGKFETVKEKHGFVVGGFSGIKYQNQETILSKGDKLFLFTDGLSEATNNKDEMYTVNRVLKVLNDNKDKSPKELLESVTKDVGKFVGDAPQFDDLTMVALERK